MKHTRHRAERVPRAAGFTLIEVLIAAMLGGVAMVAVSWAMASASGTKAIVGDQSFTATQLGREMHTLADALPRVPSGSVGASSASQVLALDSLIGASFSPPLRADLTPDAALSDWEQRTTLAIYSLDDLSTPTGEDPSDGLDPHARRLYQLGVSVLKGGVEIDSFTWWIRP